MRGEVQAGEERAAGFVASVEGQLASALEFRPYHGTLNLLIEGEPPSWPTETITGVGDDHCEGVDLTPCHVDGVRAAVLRPLVPGYPDDKIELVAPVHLRSFFAIDADEVLNVHRARRPLPAEPRQTRVSSLDAFEAVIFNFDTGLLPLLSGRSPADIVAAMRDDTDVDLRDSRVTADVDEDVAALDCPVAVLPSVTRNEAFVRDVLGDTGLKDAVDVIPDGTISDFTTLRRDADLGDAPAGNCLYVGGELFDEQLARDVGFSVLSPVQLR